MLHVYYGEGKGKTTASVGLAVRALAFGAPVRFVQFLKDGSSSEVRALAGLGATCLDDGPLAKFTFRMTPQERLASRALHDARLAELSSAWGSRAAEASSCDLALNDARLAELSSAWASQAEASSCDLSVVDECLGALAAGLVDEGVLRDLCLLAAGSDSRELVLTGRVAPEWLLGLADYATEMRCERHPFQRGVAARGGIEY